MRCTGIQEHELETSLDNEILPLVENAIETSTPATVDLPIRNVHRATGTIVSSRIARRHGGKGLPDDTITLRLHRLGRTELRGLLLPRV